MLKLTTTLLVLHILPKRLVFGLGSCCSKPWSTNLRYFGEMTEPQKRSNANKKPIHELCEYEIVAGERYVRNVKPYFQDFRTFAKGRWLGRELLEVFSREFGAHPPSYWSNALRNGQIRINERIVKPDYRLANGDAVLHRTHRLIVLTRFNTCW